MSREFHPKFILSMRMSAAAPIIPATTGFNPVMTETNTGWSWNRLNTFMIAKNSMNDGSTRASVVDAEPRIAKRLPYPASCIT